MDGRATPLPSVPDSPIGIYGTSQWEPSLRLDVARSDHLAPLFSLFGDEPAELGGRAFEHSTAQVRNLRFDLGIGKAGFDRPIERFDDVGRRVPGRADAAPRTCFVAWNELGYRGNVRQRRLITPRSKTEASYD